MKNNLFINGVEILRIEDNKYYIANTDIIDWEFMEEVSKERFEQELQKYKDVCFNSWNKCLKAQWLNIEKEIK